jgi:hypothetical protein
VIKTADGSGYTALTSAFVDGKCFLYAANFTKGRVDVFDNPFHPLDPSSTSTRTPRITIATTQLKILFADEELPCSYAPFNRHAIGNDIVSVLYQTEISAQLRNRLNPRTMKWF